jgi:hypothetical protein
MLQDPENPWEEWELTVKAPSLAKARSNCEAIAASSPLVDVLDVTQATKTPDKQGNYKFVCWFKAEVIE